VPGHIDNNEIAHHLATQGSPVPLVRPQPALGISARVLGGWVTQVENTRRIGSQVMARGRLNVFLKDPLLKGLGNYST
jgi:hypothetical protein